VSQVPRIAVGTVQPGADAQPALWALLEAFRRIGVQTQSFHCRAHFSQHDGALSITGLSTRHLDSWLMSPDTCRHLFCRAGRAVDLAVVEGSYGEIGSGHTAGGRLEPLCQWLDLPRLVVLDVPRLATCCRPPFPPRAEGVFLDDVEGTEQAAGLAAEVELLWGIPVLGAMQRAPDLRAALARVPRGDRVPAEICRQLADGLSAWWKPGRILELADRGEIPRPGDCPRCCKLHNARISVAIAYDEAFSRYFPDTLDQLELGGASIVDFSPIRDEHLPPGADIVYFGSGHPERYAAALAENHCMLAALRSHLRAGRRIYGEGGGAAYLCQHMEIAPGQICRMAGILPAVARLNPQPQPEAPVEVSFERPSWLGDAGTRLRGYRNPFWSFEVFDSLPQRPMAGPARDRLFGTFQAIGSPVNLNFAAHPETLARFFSPVMPQVGSDDWDLLPCLPR
jgi:cobyrinic acid a,c-diamide synthase